MFNWTLDKVQASLQSHSKSSEAAVARLEQECLAAVHTGVGIETFIDAGLNTQYYFVFFT